MTPREPDRFEAKAMQIVDAVTDCMNGKMEHAECLSVADHVAAALCGAESSALERAAQIVDDEEEGRTGRGFELGDVSDFRKRCVAGIRAMIPPAAAPDKPPGPHPNNPVGPERSIPERGRSSGGAPSHSIPGDVRCEKCGGWRFEPWVLQCRCAPAAENES